MANTDTEEEPDIPLVRPLDIEAIRKEATELPKLNEESDIARKLREIEREKMYNPDIIPVEQAANNSKGNFFNFLENETVNMNTEEFDLKIPVIDFNETKEEPKLDKPTNEQLANNLNINFSSTPNNFTTEISSEESFDPVDLIDTLDPEYENKVEEILGIDLKTAINAIRETKDTLSDKGFNISLEESDLNDYYQFIIKIKKD